MYEVNEESQTNKDYHRAVICQSIIILRFFFFKTPPKKKKFCDRLHSKEFVDSVKDWMSVQVLLLHVGGFAMLLLNPNRKQNNLKF